MAMMACCCKCCAFLVLALALLIGWVSTQLHPMAAVLEQVSKLQGLGKHGTEPVPDDLTPMPRPAGEMFFELPSGDRMPANGIGMCCRPTASDPVSVRRTVLWYLLQGGRHIDTASMYLNHVEVGLAIKDAMSRGVPRKEIFLVSKVWSDHYGYDLSIQRAQDMVKELGVDYIDLVLLHTPVVITPALIGKLLYSKFIDSGSTNETIASDPEHRQFRLDTWKGLSSLKAQGLIRNLGVSNFNIEQMKEIQDLKLAPIAANQMQYHPWIPSSMKDTVSYCHKSNIVVTGYWSLGGDMNKGKTLDLEILNDIAKAHARRPAQILLRWSLQNNVSIIPGTGNHKHMADNLETYAFSLPDADMERLNGMASLPIADAFFYMFDM